MADTAQSYKKTMEVGIDGKLYSGLAILPKRPQYNLEIETPQKPKMVLLTTDHRDIAFVKPGKKVRWEFRPTYLEDRLDISVLDDKGKHEWGMFFIHQDETLRALLECNGDSYRPQPAGMSACQSRIGLLQIITFDVPVSVYHPDRCPEPESKDNKSFVIKLAEGICHYLFDSGQELHRLITFGYTGVLLKDD